MGYNKENYRRIRAAYQTKYLKAYEEADRRMEALHLISPELAAIDRELAGTGAEIALATLGTGKGYQERLAAVQEKNMALQALRASVIAKLGYPADYTLPPYECKLGRDSGFVGTAGNDFTFEKIKPIPAEKVAEYGYKQSKKGKRVAVVGFGNKVTTFLPRLFSRKFVTTIAASTTKKNG